MDDHTVRFQFKAQFLDFPILLGTGNVCGAGWVVPAKYYEQVGQVGFLQKPIGAGPYKLVSQELGVKLEFEAFEHDYRSVHVKQLSMVSVPEAPTPVARLERGEADIMYFVPGELTDRVKNNPKLRLPALAVVWVRNYVKEPEVWPENRKKQREQHREVHAPLFAIFKPRFLANTLLACWWMQAASRGDGGGSSVLAPLSSASFRRRMKNFD